MPVVGAEAELSLKTCRLGHTLSCLRTPEPCLPEVRKFSEAVWLSPNQVHSVVRCSCLTLTLGVEYPVPPLSQLATLEAQPAFEIA